MHSAQQEKEKKAKDHKDLAKFYHHKAKEVPGGAFFTVTHRKAPDEHGIWARSKRELINYFNKVRRHFISVSEEV